MSKWPHKGRAVGSGVGRKHSHYYPEDKEFISEGKENPFDRFPDQQAKRFIRSRYRKVKETGELVTDPKVVKDVAFVMYKKVKAVEKALVRNLPA